MFLRDGFTATGSRRSRWRGHAWLGAHIGGQLSTAPGRSLRNDSGPALDAYSLQVGQGMYLARRVHRHRRR